MQNTKPNFSPEFKKWFGASKIVDKNGNPLPVFHGTDKDFSSFDASMTGDIGIHFGNAAQASAAVHKHWDRAQRYEDDSRLIPVFIRIEKPLYVKDSFSTMNNTWRGRAKNFGLDSGLIFNHEEHKELWSTAETLDKMRRRAGGSYSMILNKKNNALRDEYDALSKQFWNLIERVARRNGFDGMIYKNRAEGKGPSYIIFNPNQAKSVFNVGTWDNEKQDIGEDNQHIGIKNMIDVDKILKLAGLFEAKDEDFDNHSEHSRKLDQTGFWGAQGAGCIFFAKNTGRFLIAHRSSYVQEPNEWGVFGGAIDKGESPQEAVRREVHEETGYTGHFDLIPLYVFKKGSFRYSNFVAVVDKEFEPRLDWETQDTIWCEWGDWPSPMHFGLQALLNDPASAKKLQNLKAEFHPMA